MAQVERDKGPSGRKRMASSPASIRRSGKPIAGGRPVSGAKVRPGIAQSVSARYGRGVARVGAAIGAAAKGPSVSPISGRRLTPPSAEQAKKSRSILGKYR